jgi:hypothetical protein
MITPLAYAVLALCMSSFAQISESTPSAPLSVGGARFSSNYTVLAAIIDQQFAEVHAAASIAAEADAAVLADMSATVPARLATMMPLELELIPALSLAEHSALVEHTVRQMDLHIDAVDLLLARRVIGVRDLPTTPFALSVGPDAGASEPTPSSTYFFGGQGWFVVITITSGPGGPCITINVRTRSGGFAVGCCWYQDDAGEWQMACL